MGVNNRTCKVCGKKYYYCPTCGVPAPSWHKIYDEEECKDLYLSLANYYYGHITTEEINEVISNYKSEVVNEDLLPIIEKAKNEAKGNNKVKAKYDIVNESMK